MKWIRLLGTRHHSRSIRTLVIYVYSCAGKCIAFTRTSIHAVNFDLLLVYCNVTCFRLDRFILIKSSITYQMHIHKYPVPPFIY